MCWDSSCWGHLEPSLFSQVSRLCILTYIYGSVIKFQYLKLNNSSTKCSQWIIGYSIPSHTLATTDLGCEENVSIAKKMFNFSWPSLVIHSKTYWFGQPICAICLCSTKRENKLSILKHIYFYQKFCTDWGLPSFTWAKFAYECDKVVNTRVFMERFSS